MPKRQKFVAFKYGQMKLTKVGWEPEELRDLNNRLQNYLDKGWSVKNFTVVGTIDPLFVVLLEKTKEV